MSASIIAFTSWLSSARSRLARLSAWSAKVAGLATVCAGVTPVQKVPRSQTPPSYWVL